MARYASVPLSAIMKHPRKSLAPADYIPDPDERDRKIERARKAKAAAEKAEQNAVEEYERTKKTAEELGIEVIDDARS